MFTSVIPLLIKQANDVEENPGPTIFDIIDPTTTVSADSSFFQLSATVIERSRFIYTSIIASKVVSRKLAYPQ